MNLIERLAERGVEGLTRIACVLALAGLAVMVLSVLYPAPLLVIFAMSGGHAIGGAGIALYALAIFLDMRAQSLRRSRLSLPPVASVKSARDDS